MATGELLLKLNNADCMGDCDELASHPGGTNNSQSLPAQQAWLNPTSNLINLNFKHQPEKPKRNMKLHLNSHEYGQPVSTQ